MPNTPNHPSPLIAHIRNPQPRQARPGSAELETWIARTGLGVQALADVYRGLAWILRNRDARVGAVVVCVDDLGADGFEFFTLMARHRRDVPVYVYGGERASGRVTRAVEMGAAGEATEAVIGALKPESHEATEPRSHEGSGTTGHREAVGRALSADQSRDSNGADRIGHEVTTHLDQEETGAVESTAIEQQESPDGVRVPWLRYSDRPARRGPGGLIPPLNIPSPQPSALKGEGETTPSPRPSPWKGEGGAPGTSPDAPGTSPDATFAGMEYEPLLTEAELEALMSDDFDEIDPDERDMLMGDEAAGEGGRR